MTIIQAIIAIVKVITLFDKWIPLIARMFQKDPVKQINEAEKKHDEASKKANSSDDTSGSFGG